MGCNPPKQPWSPPRRETMGKSSVGVKHLNPSAQLLHSTTVGLS